MKLRFEFVFSQMAGAIAAACLLAFLLVAFPKVAVADGHSHPVCGASHVNVGDHEGSCGSLTWSSWSGADLDSSSEGLQLVSGAYYLSSDVTLSQTIIIPEGATVSLCLNGKVLSGNDSVQVLHVSPGATLNICDCAGSSAVHYFAASNGRWVLTNDSSAAKSVTGGVITGGFAKKDAVGPAGVEGSFNAGGGICVDKGTLNLYGGNVVGNRTNYYQAGGINVRASTFKMYGGMVAGNYAAGSGGGVYVADGGANGSVPASFALYGGSIANNVAQENGGGVDMTSGFFMMKAGSIKGNHSEKSGGGVFLNGGSTLRMSGGSVTANTADLSGGGVFVAAWPHVLNLSGLVDISGNNELEGVQLPSDIYLNQNTSTKDTAVIAVSGGLTNTSPSLPPMVVKSAAGAGPVVQGVASDGGQTVHSVTNDDMARFNLSSFLAEGSEFKLIHDQANNRYVVGKDASGMMVSLEQSLLTYNGQDQQPLISVALGESTLESADYVVEWPADVRNVGSKTVVVKGSQAAPNYYVGQAESSYEITAKDIASLQISGVESSYVYSGASIQPEVTVKDGDTVLVEGTDYTVSYGENTTVAQGGSVTVAMKGNYEGSTTLNFSITKAPTYYTAPTPRHDLVYDGDPQILIMQGEVTQGGTMLYGLSKEGPYAETVPTASDAGGYTVWYKVDGKGNYEEVEPTSIDVSIAPKQLGIAYATVLDRTYDGSSEVAVAEVALDGICLTDDVRVDFTDLKGSLPSANAGEYDRVALPELSLIGADAQNYIAGPADSVPLSPSAAISPVGSSYVADRTAAVVGSADQTVPLSEELKSLPGYLPSDEGSLVYTLDPSYDANLFESVSLSEDGVLTFKLKQDAPAGLHPDALKVRVVGMTNYDEVIVGVDVEVERAPVTPGQAGGAASGSSSAAATGDNVFKIVGVLGVLLLVSGVMIAVALRRR